MMDVGVGPVQVGLGSSVRSFTDGLVGLFSFRVLHDTTALGVYIILTKTIA
jgi:hypothetical protein